MSDQKPRVALQLDVPKFGSTTNFVQIHPRVIAAKWTRNNHLKADELTVTISWREGGVDPRAIKNARCGFWLWDAAKYGEDLTADNQDRFLRFTGICKKATRKIGDGGLVVELTFHDYTSFFINMKPFPTSGMPEWSDTLATAWQKICDNTGFWDPGQTKIVSSVKALRDNIKFIPTALGSRTLGEAVPKRFHAMSKPHPKAYSDAWAVWQWLVGSLGLISYIDRDQLIVTNTTEHYRAENAAQMLYGENIYDFEESVDTDVTTKGVLLKSFDPLTGTMLESFYPPPGDERLKISRAVAKRAAKEGRDPTENELSADYEEFEYHGVSDQKVLDERAREAYEERSRQEMQGSLKTAKLVVRDAKGNDVDLLDLRAGDAVMVGIRQDTLDALKSIGSEEQRVRYLVDHCGYDEQLAVLIAHNIDVDKISSPIFHIGELDVDIDGGAPKFEIELKYHNLIRV